MRIDLSALAGPSGDLLDLEVVERKGLGHPDTICDHLTEAFSQELSRQYLAKLGRIAHYNVDKALLWGGRSEPAFGGGRLTKPIEIFLAGRAVSTVGDVGVSLDDIVRDVTEQWFASNLPLIDCAAHLRTHCLVRPGSADLRALFGRNQPESPALANDTSIGVGFAPLSRVEQLALAAECALRGLESRQPAIGRDVKIMAIRHGSKVRLMIACALIDRYLESARAYADVKGVIAAEAGQTAGQHGLDAEVVVNAADDVESHSLYLTVLGTSAESGDDGQAGRGNRVNGLITPFRPMTIESVSGKNAVSHVGKLYNIAASLIAERIARLDGVAEAHCLLVSRIGNRLTDPETAAVRLRPAKGQNTGDYRCAVHGIVEEELARLPTISAALASGTARIGDWPLHS